MALRPTIWALDEAPVDNAVHVLVLLALADEANDDGSGAYPSVARIAARARVKERAAQYALRTLEEAGVIRRGDQSLAARKISRKDRRPTVYDLDLSVTWASTGMITPRDRNLENGAQIMHPVDERGASPRQNGVHGHDERGASPRQNGVHGDAPNPKDNPLEADPLKEDPAGEVSPAPSAPTATVTLRQQAEAISRGWHDRYTATVGPPADWKHIALRNLIEKAMRAGYSERDVKFALDALRRPLPSAREWQDALIEAKQGTRPTRGHNAATSNLHIAGGADDERFVQWWDAGGRA